MSDLRQRRCSPCEGGVDPLDQTAIDQYLDQLPGWQQAEDGMIERTFEFKNYYQTVAFFNAVAWMSHQEDHHPDCAIGYRQCNVRYITHAIGGLSENDFICAAKVNAILD